MDTYTRWPHKWTDEEEEEKGAQEKEKKRAAAAATRIINFAAFFRTSVPQQK